MKYFIFTHIKQYVSNQNLLWLRLFCGKVKFEFSFLVLVFSFFSAYAQDIHFTNFNLLPIQQNPSMAGKFDGEYRFGGIYRNQWATVAVPFNTLGASFDMKAFEAKNNSFLGAGLYTYFDQAGDSRFQTLYAKIPLSYNFSSPVGRNFKLNYGAGLNIGFFRKSLRTDALTFDNQFTGEVFDPNIAPSENLTPLNLFKPDLGFGLNFGLSNDDDFEINIGFAMHHLNNIQETFLNDGLQVKLNKRYAVPVMIRIPINKNWDVNVDYLYQNMARKHENIMGAVFNYYFVNNGPSKKSIGMGSYYRVGDAVSAAFRYRVNNFVAVMSYDVNISDFAAATNSYGGVEIGAVYTVKKVKKPSIKNKTKCIVF